MLLVASMKVSFSSLILFLIPASYQQDYDDSICSTPRNEIGTCIGIRQCSVLYNLIGDRNNPRAAQYIQRSTCGFEGRLPKVCCPNNSFNQPAATTTTTRTVIRNGGFNNLPSALNNECGVAGFNTSQRIVGGIPSEIGQWPWMTAIGFKIRGRRTPSKPEWNCGGAIITSRYIVTAAHCVARETTGDYEPYIVHVGDIDLEKADLGESIEIERAIIHKDYSSTKKVNDIALFRLRRDLQFNGFVQPICLPQEENLRFDLFTKRTPFVAGWGSTVFRGPTTTKLRHVQISVLDNPTCKKIFTNFGATIDENILCAGVLSGGKDSCGGDSGGPLMLPVGNKFYLIGVVSYGKKCAEAGFPGVYSRVTNYVQWISDNIVR